ncbi:hypothetical protein THAOC_23324, partial [Thalassiosira oceanica]
MEKPTPTSVCLAPGPLAPASLASPPLTALAAASTSPVLAPWNMFHPLTAVSIMPRAMSTTTVLPFARSLI